MNTSTDKSMIATFTTLAELSGPSGDEKAVADWLIAEFAHLGWKTWVDDADKNTGSTTGNVYASRHVNPARPVTVFAAHMDTVATSDDTVHVRYRNGWFHSGGATILGADNRASIACLVEAARKKELPSNVVYFFPTNEESGVMGSSYFKLPGCSIKYVFNLDEGSPPGTFVNRSLGYVNFQVIVHGVAAHAAQHYDAGKDAIRIAADLLTRLPIGADEKKGTTLNIGLVNGGIATNVVSDRVVLQGEARAFDDATREALLGSVKALCEQVSKQHGTSVELLVDTKSAIPGHALGKRSPILPVCQKACHALSLPFELKASFSTNDSSWLSQRGAPTVTVARGGRSPHSKDESISLKELLTTAALVQELASTALEDISP